MFLLESIWRFFAQLRRRRRSGGSRVSTMEERGLDRSGDRISERGGGGGFMFSARMPSSLPVVTRTVSIKRKLEELDSGLAESSGSTNSTARVRRERETVLGENFGRREAVLGENFNTGIQAQSLDLDSHMREETGIAPQDDDAVCEQGRAWDTAQPGGEIETLIDRMNFSNFGDIDNEIEKIENSSPFPVTSICPTMPERPPLEIVEPVTENDVQVAITVTTETRKSDLFPRDQEKDPAFSPIEECINLPSKFSREESCSDVNAVQGTATSSCLNGGCGGGGGCAINESLASGSTSSSSNAAIDGSKPSNDVDSSKPRLQFFVRTILDGRTIVVHASSSDSVEYVQRQIQLRTGLPIYEQRLIYGGKQLQHEQTLGDYHVANDATLHLVARMRSTTLPQSWQLINDFVATIRSICEQVPTSQRKLSHLQDSIRNQVKEFLKMAAKSVSVSEHMQVFQLSGATSALIMLLLSAVKSNRECAEESIKLFSSSNEDFLPNYIHSYCAPVLLEFCKLLAKSAPSHNLYTVCRNSLASLLDNVGVAHGSPYFNEAKAETIVQDFSPFVLELALKLSSKLRWATRHSLIKDKSLSTMQYGKEGQDFTAFVIPLCKAMEVCKGVENPLTSNENKNEGAKMSAKGEVHEKQTVMATCSRTDALMVEIGSHKWLRTVFRELLHGIDICLEAVGDVLVAPGPSAYEDGPFGWTSFLLILKGLHAIAKLYEGDMEELLSRLHARRSALNVLIQQLQWHDDHFWLLEHGFLLDFESKRRLVMVMLPEPQEDHDERQEVLVHRSQLLTDSFESLAYVEPEALQGGISIEFISEEATGPGVLREWFTLICREIFNTQNALFLSCPNDRRRFFPNPASGVNPGHLSYFRFSGRVIALALMHRVQIDMVLARTFFKHLAGLSISWEDAQDADPCLYSSCKKILEMDSDFLDSDGLGLTFVTEVEELGSWKIMELCPGGRDMVVNSKNRHQYVKLLIQQRFVTPVAEQVKCFAQGFSDLLGNSTHQQFLRALEPEDLDLMLYGKDHDICVDDWKRHTEYHEYTEADDQMVWFWQVINGMTMEQRRRVIFFSTSLTHPPAEGFSGLSSKFHIHKAHTDPSWLPTAHTCFYQLVLPPYPSFEVMHSRLHAITEVHVAEGFGFA